MLKGIIKTVVTNWRDLTAIIVGLIVLYLALGWVESLNTPRVGSNGELEASKWGFLYEFVKFLQVIVAFTIAVGSPWLLIAITFPKTYGRFVNDNFNRAFALLGAEEITAAQYTELSMPNGMTKPSFAYAQILSTQFKSMMRVYFMFLTAEILAWLAVM